jgi:hypothetical protein
MKKILSICVLSGVLLWSGSVFAKIGANGIEPQGVLLNGIIVNGNTIDAQPVNSLTTLDESHFLQRTQLPVEVVKLPNA